MSYQTRSRSSEPGRWPGCPPRCWRPIRQRLSWDTLVEKHPVLRVNRGNKTSGFSSNLSQLMIKKHVTGIWASGDWFPYLFHTFYFSQLTFRKCCFFWTILDQPIRFSLYSACVETKERAPERLLHLLVPRPVIRFSNETVSIRHLNKRYIRN